MRRKKAGAAAPRSIEQPWRHLVPELGGVFREGAPAKVEGSLCSDRPVVLRNLYCVHCLGAAKRETGNTYIYLLKKNILLT